MATNLGQRQRQRYDYQECEDVAGREMQELSETLMLEKAILLFVIFINTIAS
jgi:hypothetical protein